MDQHQQLAHVRHFGTSSTTKEQEQSNHDSSSHHGSSDSTTSIKESKNKDGTNKNNPAEIVYRGGLADATLRLKRVSITTCMLGLVGMPLLAILYGSDVSSTGQMAVGGTAIFAATGSTAALTYCISPYVHLIEKIEKHNHSQEPKEGTNNNDESSEGADYYLLQATTRDIFARERKTLFDPTKDISHNVGSRPFCNFIAKGVPMYVHPELIEDEVLRKQLVGEKAIEKTKPTPNQQKDDEFL